MRDAQGAALLLAATGRALPPGCFEEEPAVVPQSGHLRVPLRPADISLQCSSIAALLLVLQVNPQLPVFQTSRNNPLMHPYGAPAPPDTIRPQRGIALPPPVPAPAPGPWVRRVAMHELQY